MSRPMILSRRSYRQCSDAVLSNAATTSRCRAFSTTKSQSLNPLLNLSGLAFSKEAQYFSKERKIPREEYSSNLQLIRSSEVDPFAPAPGASPTVVAALKRAQRGESDMQTAYSLAISNLLAQLETSRTEAKQVTEALLKLQDKHHSLEKHALLMMLGIVAALSITFFRPDAFDVIGKDIEAARLKWHDFDWQWLGNPPKYKTVVAAKGSPFASTDSPSTTNRAVPTVQEEVVPRILEHSIPSGGQNTVDAKVFSWTRLFWASPTDPRKSI